MRNIHTKKKEEKYRASTEESIIIRTHGKNFVVVEVPEKVGQNGEFC